MSWRMIFVCGMVFLGACGGGGSGGNGEGSSTSVDSGNATCTGQCAEGGFALTVADVKQVLAQAIAQADAMGALATIAVVDRVGNVLAVYSMAQGGQNVTISTTFPTTISGGLEGIVLPAGTNADTLAAIAKAITGAYLSSEGNAFTTRSAN